MSFTTAPLPPDDALVDPQRGYKATDVLVDWANALATDVDASPARLETVALEEQDASIGTTTINVGSLAEGLYRFTYYARITQAATVSSSLTVTAGWTESGIALTLSGSAMTGNTTGTVQSGSWLLQVDPGAGLISYSTSYASVGGTSMKYRLSIVCEQIDA